MTGCRIGKIKLKAGGELHNITPLREVFENDHTFCEIDELVKFRKEGRIKSVAFAVLLDDGKFYLDFAKRQGAHTTDIIGMVEMLKNSIYDWYKSTL